MLLFHWTEEKYFYRQKWPHLFRLKGWCRCVRLFTCSPVCVSVYARLFGPTETHSNKSLNQSKISSSGQTEDYPVKTLPLFHIKSLRCRLGEGFYGETLQEVQSAVQSRDSWSAVSQQPECGSMTWYLINKLSTGSARSTVHSSIKHDDIIQLMEQRKISDCQRPQTSVSDGRG